MIGVVELFRRSVIPFAIWLASPFALADRLYWDNSNGSGSIQRGTKNGTHIDDVIVGTFAQDIVIDIINRRIYWTSFVDPPLRVALFSAGLNGESPQQLLVTDSQFSVGIAIDLVGGKIYWGEPTVVRRANLDGTSAETVISGVFGFEQAEGIAIDAKTEKLYWVTNCVDTGPCGSIWRANLDGAGIENLIPSGHNLPRRIALDTQNGKMYWTDEANIRCANLNGADVQDVVLGVYPWDLVVDEEFNKVYWTSRFVGKVRRANLDGTQVEDLVTGLGLTDGLGIEVSVDVPAISYEGIGILVTCVMLIGGLLAILSTDGKSINE